MKLYEKFAQDIIYLIKTGVLKPGEKLPSIRHASNTHKISPSTVLKAYYLLEDRGLIFPRPKSGYFVRNIATDSFAKPKTQHKKAVTTDVKVSDLIFSVMDVIQNNEATLFAAFYPSTELFPVQRLNRSMNHALKELANHKHNYIADMTAGNPELIRQIIMRYRLNNVELLMNEVIITNGVMEALSLCLQAVTKPGDLIVIESPTFYAILQILERLKLKAVEIPTHPQTGIDLAILDKTLQDLPIAACCLMTNFQNPTGATICDADKAKLYNILNKHQAPTIVDDVYHELYFDAKPPKLLKSFDQNGLIMHCCSFSKSLAPGYRVGYVAAGRYAEKINKLKLMSTLSTSVPAQAAIANYLKFGGYDRHLRQLRHTLACSQARMLNAINRYFPKNIALTIPKGGYFLWIELDKKVDALDLYQTALNEGICIAPGVLFSASNSFRNCIRLNYGLIWSDKYEQSMRQLGNLIKSY